MGVTKQLIQALPAAVADWDAESRRAKSVERICRSAQGWGGEGDGCTTGPTQPALGSLSLSLPVSTCFWKPSEIACVRVMVVVLHHHHHHQNPHEFHTRNDIPAQEGESVTKGSVKMRGSEAQTYGKTSSTM
ncbi:hypothetical protein CGRA01v4_09395 [Colletotrichum graminicola]|nr:hypothetical protein CGRA01v4_09395 [Colletotrichum graminicola]